MSQEQEIERKILAAMRKVLASVIKDTTPAHRSMQHPLSDSTIQDIRQCLGLISARERDLADRAGIGQEKPYFTDETTTAEVVSITSIKTIRKEEDSDE
ncbi:MAG: segregation and condensation protein A [bacterium]